MKTSKNMKRFFKPVMGGVVVAMIGFVGYQAYSAQGATDENSLFLANVEALTDDNETTQCPDPDDVRDHHFSFEQREGSFTVDANGEIDFFGKKNTVGDVEANVEVTVTYEIGNCDTQSPGNCCPVSRIGETKIVGIL